ncbi:hypothetical protein GCM10025774_05530 [Microbacterium kyungheense]
MLEELGHHLDALGLDTVPHEEVGPVPRAAADVEHGTVDTACPPEDQRTVGLVRGIRRSEQVDVLGSARGVRG